jgi:6,7-dimethyl-8-ribityllumazine synthase
MDAGMSLFRAPAAKVDASKFRVAIVAAQFNPQWVDVLLERCVEALAASGVTAKRLRVERVPGSHEVPWAVARVCQLHLPDVVIALGVLLKGSTNHHEMVATAVAGELLALSTRLNIPVVNGVMAVETPHQAEERCCGRINRGLEFAEVALAMAELNRKLR